MNLTSVIYVYDLNNTHGNRNLGDFTTTVSIIPPDYTLTSNATLRGAQFSHNNYVLECLSLTLISLNGTIVIEGACIVLKAADFNTRWQMFIII